MSKILQDLITELRAEAAFNRSFVDGSRDRPEAASLGYEARRTELAEQRDAWADAVEKLLAASPVEQLAPLTAQAALAAIETFEIVGENNDSREPGDEDRFILTEFIAHLFGGYRVDQPGPAAPLEGTGNGADERATWDRTRHALAVAMVGFADRPELIRRNLDAALHVLDTLTESGSPLGWLRTARAPRTEVAGAVSDGLPDWFETFLTNVCEIPDRNSPEGEPDAIVATLDELRNCAVNAIEQCVSYAQPPSADAAAAPADDGQFYELVTAYGEACHLMTNSKRITETKDAVLAAYAARTKAAQLEPPAADERAAFEAWAKKKGCDLESYDSGDYCDIDTQWMWEGWEARAAASQPAAAAGQETVAIGYVPTYIIDEIVAGKNVRVHINRTRTIDHDAPLYTAAPAQPAAGPAVDGVIVGAWMTDDDRAITAAQKQRALADGGATASSVQPYSIPCYLGAPPAQVATRQGLTDAQIIEVASKFAHSDGWLDGNGALAFGRALLEGAKQS